MKRFAAGVAAVTLPLVIFGPSIVPLCWHLRHGEAVEYLGRRVPVPHRWYAKQEFRRLELVKPPLTVLTLGSAPPVWSSLGPVGGGRPKSVEEAYRSFEAYFQDYGVRTGQVVSEPVRLGTGEFVSVCVKRSPKSGSFQSAVSCQLFAGTWMGEFVGRTEEVDNFLDVIREMAK